MSGNESGQDYWGSHYNDTAGPVKVMLRRALNFCLAPGEETIDFDEFTIDTLYSAGLPKTDTVLDVGCGGLFKFLKLFEKADHEGKIIGAEPNTKQIGVDTWEPGDPHPDLEKLKASGDTEGIDEFFERFKNHAPRVTQIGRITLIETVANYLPIPTGSTGVTSSMFAAYAIPKPKQPAAFREMARTVSESGIMPIALSHDGNKAGIRQEEEEIASKLEKITRAQVTAPKPINAGLTTEGGVELMCDIWPRVYLFEHTGTIYINTPRRADSYLSAHYTTGDLYTIGKGKSSRRVTREEYSEAIDDVVGAKIRAADIKDDGSGGVLTDVLKQGLILGSNVELDVPIGPKDFQIIKGAAQF